MADADQFIDGHFRRSCEALERAAGDASLRSSIKAIAEAIAGSLRAGGKLLLAGNGGSAADAQHIAAELVGRLTVNRAPLAAIALTTDTSALTAISNDFGFDAVFERQLRGLGRAGDVFIGISTSGRSPNIVAALKAAREMKIVTVGMTGNREAPMNPLCDHRVAVPTEDTQFIQQIHIVAAHAICELVERQMFGAR
jgi:D-sedoheptulose 7-phosphate isomerase